MERWRRAETVILDSGSQTFAQWEEHSWALHTFNESNENFDCMVKNCSAHKTVTEAQRDSKRWICIKTETLTFKSCWLSLIFWLMGVCLAAELYEIFLSRAKEKWRSYSETSSVNDSESGTTPLLSLTLTAPVSATENYFCVFLPLDGGASLADRESSLDLIKLDISRTFPSLFIFQKVNTDNRQRTIQVCSTAAANAAVWFLLRWEKNLVGFSDICFWTCDVCVGVFVPRFFSLPATNSQQVNHICVSHECLLCLPPAGRSVPRPPPQRAGCLHVLQAWHWLCE